MPVRLPAKLVAAAAIVVAALLPALVAPPASAATIEGAITSVTTTERVVAQNDRVEFSCTWAVPDHSQPGDQFTLQLPAQLRWNRTVATDFSLRSPAPENAEVATAHVDGNGLITFTLTDFVASHPLDVHGSCTFYTEVTYAGGEAETMQLSFGSIVVPLAYDPDAHACPSCGTEVTVAKKMMWWSDAAQTRLDVYILTPKTKTAGPVTIVDTPGPGLRANCPILEANVSDRYFEGNGMALAPFDDVTPDVDCADGQVTVHWPSIEAGRYITIHLTMSVTDPSLKEYGNSGTVTMNDGEVTPISVVTQRQAAGGDGDGTGDTPDTPNTPDVPSTPDVPATPDVPSTPSTSVTPQAAVAASATNLASTGADGRPLLAAAALALLTTFAGGMLLTRRRPRAK
ncbi:MULTISPECIES: Ig-like domain-containing protein [unclassified Microbacterium]|uniref:Ig-like domain-containing protein n=1 Tax=unclassified Microbacterium TaxID=2609290 RepID=UPI0030196F7D